MDDKTKQRLEAKLRFTEQALQEAQKRHLAHQNARNAKSAELNSLIYNHNNQVKAITDQLTALEGPQQKQAAVDVEVAQELFDAAKAELEREKLKDEAQAKGLKVA